MTLRNQSNFQCSPFQRLCIRTLLREMEMPVDVTSAAHAAVFAEACIPFPSSCRALDDVLCALTAAQAAALLGSLQRQRAAMGLADPLPVHEKSGDAS
jgi:hypothetical protein